MPTQWVVEVRLGERPDARPIRRVVLTAETELDALRLAVRQAETEGAGAEGQIENDGQEEVFSREEVALGRVEHHAGENDNP